MWYTHTQKGILFSYKTWWNSIICVKMDATKGHRIEWNKLHTERQTLHVLSCNGS